MAETGPLVSVVMSVYNGEDHLAEAIESMLGQTYTRFELILIDDGSSDRSGEIAQAYVGRDPRVRVLSHENRGLAASLNRGIEEAQGPLLARLDADDVAPPGRLAAQVAFMEAHPSVGLLSGQAVYIDDAGRETGRWGVPTDPGAIAFFLVFRTCLPHPGVLTRTDLVRALGGYNPALRTNQDYDLWTRMLFETRIANLSEVVVHRRRGEGQLSRARHQEQQANARAAVRKLHGRLLGTEPDVSESFVTELRDAIQGPSWAGMSPERAGEAFDYVRRITNAFQAACRRGDLPLTRSDRRSAEATAVAFLRALSARAAGGSWVRAAGFASQLVRLSPVRGSERLARDAARSVRRRLAPA